MTDRKPRRPRTQREVDTLDDLAGVLPPDPPEPPSTYVKRHAAWCTEGVAALAGGATYDDAARLDDETQDAWDAEEERQRQAAELRLERQRLNVQEQKLRVADRVRRLRRRQERGDV